MLSADTDGTTTLRELFDRLVELPTDARISEIASLKLPDRLLERLRKMLLFDDLSVLDEEAYTTTVRNEPEATRSRFHTMWERNRHLRQGAAVLLRQVQREGAEEIAETLVGSTVGTFRLVSLVGQGGSSSVFRAERQAGDGCQVVALKLLRTGLYSSDAQRRFRREQAILAQLYHPNIARLIEGGVSEAGIPYIAMELVEGVPITRAANERHLGIRQRLEWFVILCRAIESAHAALIIHRDLKPSNLFVDGDGVLKVLDFGIAKLIESDATRTQWIALTPGYAAPEQFEQGPLTTAVDVYALGVVLGELLTGLQLKGDVRASHATAVNSDAAVPSGLPSHPGLAQQLRGDIDAIIATAMATEPRSRYLSAGALADDVERHLCGEPVRAVAPSRWYVVRKFLVRHQLAIAAASFVLLAVLTCLAVVVLQGFEIQHAAQRAEAQAARANAMRDFIFDAFAEAEPARPHDGPITVNEIVDRAIFRTRSDRSIDPNARLELLGRLGEVVDAQGDLTKGGALLRDARDEALRLRGPDDSLTLELARSVENNHELQGDYPTARSEADALLAGMPVAAVELRINVLRDSADIAIRTRDQQRALKDIRESVDLARSSRNVEALRKSLEECGIVMMSAGRIDEALAVLEEVLMLTRRRFGEESNETAAVLGDLSRDYRRAGNLNTADSYARAALAIDKKIYAGDHWVTANHLNALGQVLVAKRDLAEALSTYAEGERMSETTLGPSHPETSSAMQALAYVEMQLEQYDRALPQLHASLMVKIENFGSRHWETAFVRSDYGFALAMNGSVRAGEREMDQAIADLKELAVPDPHTLGRAIEKRIRLALSRKQAAVAAALVDQMAQAAKESFQQASYWAGRTDCIRGAIAIDLAKFDDAISSLGSCASALDRTTSPDPVLLVEQRLLEALASAHGHDRERAEGLAAEARERLHSLAYPPSRLKLLEHELAQTLPEIRTR